MLNKEVPFREKFLLLLLIIVLMVTGFIKLVAQPTEKATERARAEIITYQDELDMINARLIQLEEMRQKTEESKKHTDARYIPSYNLEREETAFLDEVLSVTHGYSIIWTDAVYEGRLVRRAVTIQLTCDSADTAENIVKALETSQCYCVIIKDMSYALVQNNGGQTVVNCAMNLTFYETL